MLKVQLFVGSSPISLLLGIPVAGVAANKPPVKS